MYPVSQTPHPGHFTPLVCPLRPVVSYNNTKVHPSHRLFVVFVSLLIVIPSKCSLLRNRICRERDRSINSRLFALAFDGFSFSLVRHRHRYLSPSIINHHNHTVPHFCSRLSAFSFSSLFFLFAFLSIAFLLFSRTDLVMVFGD
ncbi:hypothetical protein GGR50DRAFT_663774 [Xylaria sp. CBS 124048]|nr:hypothetical protein GGR50DRAFT_663774 [Xylaria sp. CBS 124048]